MGHLGNIKEEHLAWVRRLAAGTTTGLPEPHDEKAWAGWKEVLEILCTPEQARLAARMPVLPSSLEKIARRTRLEPGELRVRLEALCDRGIVMDLIDPRSGATTYFLSPSVIGFIEFSMMRTNDGIPKKRMAEALEAYTLGDETLAREVFGHPTVVGRALVNEEALAQDERPETLDWERATELVRSAPSVAVSLCYCRHKAEHLGKACAAPLESCLSLGSGSSYLVRRGFARQIPQGRALEILEQAREQRLVQIADNVREKPSFICNCCGCCCGQLQAINVYGLPAVTPSGFGPRWDSERCSGCGACARACPIGATRLEKASGEASRPRLELDTERCIGCGLCAASCRRGALSMVARPRKPDVPTDTVERIVRMAIERGQLASLVFDEGAGRGHRWLNRLLRGLLALPPAKRALADEQLRSRLVRAVLARVPAAR